jgi:phosphoglucomutase
MIHFGTSGWRGIVGQDFTFRSVRLLLEATVSVLRQRGPIGEVIVSYDTRLLSEKFAREAVSVFTHHGIRTVLSDRDLPSPCVAFAVRERRATLGVTFTASHNPPEYNGVKLYTSEGAPAARELLGAIERAAAGAQEGFYVPQRELGRTESLAEGYLAALESGVDWEAIRASGLKVAVDPLYGTSREFLDRVLLAHQVPTVSVHSTKDPYFGGYAPECTPTNLAGLRELVRTSGADLGLATDGDADRFGIVNSACRSVSPSLAIALLTDYLVRRRGVRGGIARTVGTSRLVDRIARAHSLELLETPVGFYHLAQLMVAGKAAVALEESAGIGVNTHLPERDGIYAGLLVAEMAAVEGKSIPELARALFDRYGTLLFRRTQLPWRERTRKAYARLLSERHRSFVGRRVVREDRGDGLLMELEDGAWLLLRPATTEPKLRLYVEATTSRDLHALVRETRRLLREHEEEDGHV